MTEPIGSREPIKLSDKPLVTASWPPAIDETPKEQVRLTPTAIFLYFSASLLGGALCQLCLFVFANFIGVMVFGLIPVHTNDLGGIDDNTAGPSNWLFILVSIALIVAATRFAIKRRVDERIWGFCAGYLLATALGEWFWFSMDYAFKHGTATW